jgi:hypothetical protein
LREIHFNARKIGDYYWKQLCGQRLENIDINRTDRRELAAIIRSTPILKTFTVYGNFDAIIEQYLPKFKKISFLTF